MLVDCWWCWLCLRKGGFPLFIIECTSLPPKDAYKHQESGKIVGVRNVSKVLQRWIDQKKLRVVFRLNWPYWSGVIPPVGSACAVHYCTFVHSGGLLISLVKAPQTTANALTVNKPAQWLGALNVKLVLLQAVTRGSDRAVWLFKNNMVKRFSCWEGFLAARAPVKFSEPALTWPGSKLPIPSGPPRQIMYALYIHFAQ